MQKVLLLPILLLFGVLTVVQGQNNRLADRLWYGAGLTGRYQGNSFSSTFAIGVAPMVGYKITPNLSFGPRVSAVVSFYRTRGFSGGNESANPMDWSVGVFGRYRIAREFFAQVEYAFEDEAFIIQDVSGLVIDREVNNKFYIGGGYSSPISDLVGIEISIMLNVNQPIDDFRSPIDYRFGINYRF